MSQPTMTYAPGPSQDTVLSPDGTEKPVLVGWALLPPGDAALTRRVKTAGEFWAVAEKKGRKVLSRGVWAPAAIVERVRAELEAERSTAGFARKKEADARRRDKAQAEYVEDFHGAVVTFLGFHPDHVDLAHRLARAVTALALCRGEVDTGHRDRHRDGASSTAHGTFGAGEVAGTAWLYRPARRYPPGGLSHVWYPRFTRLPGIAHPPTPIDVKLDGKPNFLVADGA